ncbi:hypothetical protein P691DRAFT_772962 [Macrolepiota fuliginosa MF-IS2]|uniref:Uncharacterized protein n=1 Tax=Macrolepiota fuliginosa MF-IS2 TaxID=1400762 RepID=A0A9P5XJS1_9AGAR|nr:hypothetical protein P691DRAFT_772962 [Macrolepiota fuliginosa MF-IS2]
MFFPRPESPPPRVPSPPPRVFTPLASPSSRSHRKPSSSSSAPSLPPGLQQERTLLTVRSYEHLSSRNAEHRRPKRTRSALGHAASGLRTHSLPEPFTPPAISRPHYRTASLTSRASPPPSPMLHSPPPPVPPIPSFILTPADKKSPRSADSLPVTPIYLPDLDPVSPIADLPASVIKSSKKAGLAKTRSAGVTCLKFFSLRNSLKSNRL